MSQKRKLEEFHDPDYPQNNSKIARINNAGPEEKINRIKEIINTEFQREVDYKEEQLSEIYKKLSTVKELLHEVRYRVISDYYNKEQLRFAEAETLNARTSSLFDNEPNGPQLPLHPAIKKIIGKKPRTYEELVTTCPTEREAAKTAKSNILEKTRSKKEEKRIERMIKQKGIVIDHSNTGGKTAIEDVLPADIKIPRHISPIKVEKPISKLNTARMNNQTKYLVVVGNTSKYIGNEKPSDNSTHKWMIYLQCKSGVPIEKFVSKVRFFLHSSYKPNDVVDVEVPPFQLARRGWGEFPVRLQLFFNPSTQQKPIQLEHNLVLDKTLSGLQTMGAETLVEIWLRNYTMPVQIPVKSPESSPQLNTLSKSTNLLSPIKTAEIINPKPEIDENLFDFLDKIETPAICADLEKIEPTFMDSPLVDNILPRKPLGKPPVCTITESITRLSKNESREETSVPQTNVQPAQNKETIHHVVLKTDTNTQQPQKSEEVGNIVQSPQQPVIKKPPSVVNAKKQIILPGKPKILQKKVVQLVDKDGKIRLVPMLFLPKDGVCPQIKHPKVNNMNGISSQSTTKLLQVNVNAVTTNQHQNGANKTMCSIPVNPTPKILEPVNSVNLNSSSKVQIENSPVKSPSLLRPSGPLRNNVIHKEGKVYIIDPLQTKLKQQQQKQVSLLKPQVNLNKNSGQTQNIDNPQRATLGKISDPASLPIDHDYSMHTISLGTPKGKHVGQVRAPINHSTIVTVKNFPNPSNFIPSKVPELKKGNFFPVKVNHKPVIALMKKQRIEYRRELEQQFHNSYFANIRSGVEFLLRRLPMVNNLAIENDYRMAFPFVVSSWSEFRKIIPPKLKALEWLRSKYIHKRVNQHPILKDIESWTTKEIVYFARHHAYTPPIPRMEFDRLGFKISDEDKTGLDQQQTSFRDLVKSAIEKESVSYLTITPNHQICDWVEESSRQINLQLKSSDIYIDVDGLDDPKNQPRRSDHNKESTSKAHVGKLWLSVDEKLEKEANLVSELVQDIGIRLCPEEIHQDVVHPTSQTIMAQMLRLFVQDIVRRSIAFKLRNNNQKSWSGSIELEPNDIRNGITSKSEFDFLTDKYIGTIKSKDLFDLG